MRILALNAGSGTVEATAFEVRRGQPSRDGRAKLTHHTEPAILDSELGEEAVEASDRSGQLAALLDVMDLGEVDVVAHRIVHGGKLREHAVVDGPVRRAVDEATALAPLHNGPAVELLDLSADRVPGATHVACLDTAFHASIPDPAAIYGGPWSWWERGLRRYGFHGLSHRDASSRAAEVMGVPVDALALVSVHCGGGVSAAAVVDGRSVDTTMGLTPAEGPIMASRSGSVDPGLLIHLMRQDGLDADGLESLLMSESGMLGLSGQTGGEEQLRRRRNEDPRAALAVDAYVHSLRRSVASMLPAAGRLDGLVLTGDVLESDADLRAELCAGLAFAGVELDDGANRGWDGADADLSAPGSQASVLVVAADEAATMARLALEVTGDVTAGAGG